MNKFLLGLDLGQVRDYTALSIIEKITEDDTEAIYHLRHIQRFPLKTTYPEIVDKVCDIFNSDKISKYSRLIVDATGVGRPVVDLFKKKQLYPKAITITGGYDVIKDNGEYKVPKRDLVTNLQVLFQQEKLKIAEDLQEAKTLVQELLNFKVKIKDNARESFEAWREGIHDDLVLAVALACWWGEKMDKKIELW